MSCRCQTSHYFLLWAKNCLFKELITKSLCNELIRWQRMSVQSICTFASRNKFVTNHTSWRQVTYRPNTHGYLTQPSQLCSCVGRDGWRSLKIIGVIRWTPSSSSTSVDRSTTPPEGPAAPPPLHIHHCSRWASRSPLLVGVQRPPKNFRIDCHTFPSGLTS